MTPREKVEWCLAEARKITEKKENEEASFYEIILLAQMIYEEVGRGANPRRRK